MNITLDGLLQNNTIPLSCKQHTIDRFVLDYDTVNLNLIVNTQLVHVIRFFLLNFLYHSFNFFLEPRKCFPENFLVVYLRWH